MTPKLIKTEADHAAALSRLEEIFEAELGTPEGDEAELLTALIELYEEKNFPIDRPVPLEAIRFRMEQQGLKPKDIVPYIGSASKVSEVLSGRRRLSLNMIRNLSEGLAIPAGVLLGNAEAKIDPDHPALQGRRFPIAEMLKRGWFAGFSGTLSEVAPESWTAGMVKSRTTNDPASCPRNVVHSVPSSKPRSGLRPSRASSRSKIGRAHV